MFATITVTATWQSEPSTGRMSNGRTDKPKPAKTLINARHVVAVGGVDRDEKAVIMSNGTVLYTPDDVAWELARATLLADNVRGD